MSSATALTVPILPPTAPAAKQPPSFRLPLYPHQQRALHRCLVIEKDGKLNADFGDRFDYQSRGGCLADCVGTGKTAVAIALCLHEKGSSTLVVAPSHLIPQWQAEIAKMVKPHGVEVIVGREAYKVVDDKDETTSSTPRIVLVDVDTVLTEDRVWYDWYKVFTDWEGRRGSRLKVSPEELQLYRKAALFCVQSPRGPCAYAGWVYRGPLHLPKRPWSRVIFDEIQDLVSAGSDSQKNLLQLSRTAKNVWLLSATPFPHGNKSIYANHELLGFCRLKMNINDDQKLPANHTFERIKRQLYIRSPRHIADDAVRTPVTRNTIQVTPLDLERRFYLLEMNSVNSSMEDNNFGPDYQQVREMTVHPEANAAWNRHTNSNISRTTIISSSVSAAAVRAVGIARCELAELGSVDQANRSIHHTEKSLRLAEKVAAHRNQRAAALNTFARSSSSNTTQSDTMISEEQLIHDHYCSCKAPPGSAKCYADRHVSFRIMSVDNGGCEFIKGPDALRRTVAYFDAALNAASQVNVGTGTRVALDQYISVSKRTLLAKQKQARELEEKRRSLQLRITTLSRSNNQQVKSETDTDQLAHTHGSKPAALVRFLERVVDQEKQQVIVFSYWHDTLKLVQRTLTKCGLESTFCHGKSMGHALESFTSGAVPILLLSASSKASGANLQCASHVVLLDPAGSSAKHGCALEEQAIGRAVRMGQTNPVTVTRFCVVGTIEETLFQEIDQARAVSLSFSHRSDYVIQDAHKKLEGEGDGVGEDDEDDIKVTVALTGGECLDRDFSRAKDLGKIIDISDDENASNNEGTTAHIKREYVSVENDRKDGPEIDELKSPDQKRPRTCASYASSPPSIVTPADKPPKDTVGELLSRLNLQQYEKKFAAFGYDSVEFLYNCSGDKHAMEKLSKSVGFGLDHAVRFVVGLSNEAKQVAGGNLK